MYKIYAEDYNTSVAVNMTNNVRSGISIKFFFSIPGFPSIFKNIAP